MDPNRSVKKKLIKKAESLISLAVAAALMASCSAKPEPAKDATAKNVIETTVTVETTVEEDTGPEFPPITYDISDPELEKAEGLTKEVYFSRDGQLICGKITYPNSREFGQGPYKTIIFSHGLYAPLGRYSDKARYYSEYGYAVIEFEFQNSDVPDPYEDPEYIGDYIYEEVKDLFAVIDSAKYLPDVDASNIYLYGHSMGGLVASYAGAMRQEDIKGLILVDPSFYATDLMEFEKEQTITTDIYSLLKELTIPVLIITGTEGSFGEDPHFFDDARKAIPHCQYIVIEGADHIFGGEASEHLVDVSVEAMKKWE